MILTLLRIMLTANSGVFFVGYDAGGVFLKIEGLIKLLVGLHHQCDKIPGRVQGCY